MCVHSYAISDSSSWTIAIPLPVVTSSPGWNITQRGNPTPGQLATPKDDSRSQCVFRLFRMWMGLKWIECIQLLVFYDVVICCLLIETYVDSCGVYTPATTLTTTHLSQSVFFLHKRLGQKVPNRLSLQHCGKAQCGPGCDLRLTLA